MPPTYLLADSQLLFWTNDGLPFLSSVIDAAGTSPPTAAYIGASNGDRDEFFDLFVAAMGTVGVYDCRKISSRFEAWDRTNLAASHIVLLAGGDIHLGWDIMVRTGLNEAIAQRHREGAVLLGVSAGAVQLGLKGWAQERPVKADVFETLGLVPLVIDVHDEENDWGRLELILESTGSFVAGLGIPTGGGVIVHEDSTVEPVRFPVVEAQVTPDRTARRLLIPMSQAAEVPSSTLDRHTGSGEAPA